MTKEQKFYKVLQAVFIGAKIEGTGGFSEFEVFGKLWIKKNKIEDVLNIF